MCHKAVGKMMKSPSNEDAHNINIEKINLYTKDLRTEKMLISFPTKGERKDINSGSLRLSKTQNKELKNSDKRDIGRKILLPIRRFLIIGKKKLLALALKNAGLVEKLDILLLNVPRENKKLQK